MITFKQARQAVLSELARRGWTVRAEFKVPHATSPDDKVRLWFRPQAVYAVHQLRVRDGADPLQLKDAHSMCSDLRELAEPERFLDTVRRWTGWGD